MKLSRFGEKFAGESGIVGTAGADEGFADVGIQYVALVESCTE